MNKFQYSLSVIIPIYNEEKILSEIIEKLFYSLNEILNDFEILIIENGSIDKSYELSKKLASEFTEIKAVHLEEANYGNALREGIKLSSKKYTVNFSIDFIDLVFLNIVIIQASQLSLLQLGLNLLLVILKINFLTIQFFL